MYPNTNDLLDIEIGVCTNGELTAEIFTTGEELPVTKEEFVAVLERTHHVGEALHFIFFGNNNY